MKMNQEGRWLSNGSLHGDFETSKKKTQHSLGPSLATHAQSTDFNIVLLVSERVETCMGDFRRHPPAEQHMDGHHDNEHM